MGVSIVTATLRNFAASITSLSLPAFVCLMKALLEENITKISFSADLMRLFANS
jgi:hypothetical protein